MIYFIAETERANNHIKIGYTSGDDCARRLDSLQTASPSKLEVLMYIPGGMHTEVFLHKKFAHLRVGGEWFTDTTKEIKDYIIILRLLQELLESIGKDFKLLDEHGSASPDNRESLTNANQTKKVKIALRRELISNIMADEKLTQAELTERLGVSLGTVKNDLRAMNGSLTNS